MKLKRPRVAFCALVLVAAGVLAAWSWCQNRVLRQVATASLAKHCDGYVEVAGARWRFGTGMVLWGLRLHRSAEPDSPVVCEIERAEVRTSLWSLVRDGCEPATVIVYRPRLRVIRDGNRWRLELPVRLSSPPVGVRINRLHVEDGMLELAGSESGSPASTVESVWLDLAQKPGTDAIELTGQVVDPLWSRWELSGRVDSAAGRCVLRARCDRLELRPELAQWLGPEPARIWARLRPQGSVRVQATLSWDATAENGVGYQVLIDPLNVRLALPGAASPLTDVSGRIELTAAGLTTHGVVAELGGGKLHFWGQLAWTEPVRFHIRAGLVDVAAGQLLENLACPRFDLQSGPRLTGTLELSGGPEPASWRGNFDGTCLWPDLNEGSPFEFRAQVQDGVVRLADVTLRVADGQVGVKASLPLESGGRLGGTLSLKGVSIEQLWRLAGGQTSRLHGWASGEVGFGVPLASVSDPAKWNCQGHLRLDRVQAGKIKLAWIEGELDCRDGLLRLHDGAAQVGRNRLRGQLSVDLSSPYRIDSRFQTEPAELAELAEQPGRGIGQPAMHGILRAAGRLSGTLVPPKLRLEGNGTLQALSMGRAQLGDASFRYLYRDNGFDLEQVQLPVWGGLVRGQGRWRKLEPEPARQDQGSGSEPSGPPARFLHLEGQFEAIDLDQLCSSCLGKEPSGKLGGSLAGDFTLDWHVGTPVPDAARRLSGSFRASQLRLGPAVVNTVGGRFVFTPDGLNLPHWSARLGGDPLSGGLRLVRGATGPQLTGQVSSPGLELDNLLRRLGLTAGPPLVSGRVAVGGSWQLDPATGSLTGNGRLYGKRIVVARRLHLDSMESDWEFGPDQVRLYNCAASFYGGRADGQVVVRRGPQQAVEVTVRRAEGIDLARLLDPWPTLRGRAGGKLAGSGTFRMGLSPPARLLDGAAAYQVEEGWFAKLPVRYAQGKLYVGPQTQGHVPTSLAYGLKQAAQYPRPPVLAVIDLALVAGGRVDGSALLYGSNPTRYHADLSFDQLDVATLDRAYLSRNHSVAGKLSGRLNLRGPIDQTRQASGELMVELSDANLWSYPIFDVLAMVLNLDLSKRGAFRTGRGRATLADGRVTFQEFWLTSDAAQLYGNGIVDAEGRIDLEVVGNVRIAQGLDILRMFRSPLDTLQRQLVKIAIRGTLDRPRAVPVPLHEVSKPALRFFRAVLEGTLPGAAASRRRLRR